MIAFYLANSCSLQSAQCMECDPDKTTVYNVFDLPTVYYTVRMVFQKYFLLFSFLYV